MFVDSPSYDVCFLFRVTKTRKIAIIVYPDEKCSSSRVGEGDHLLHDLVRKSGLSLEFKICAFATSYEHRKLTQGDGIHSASFNVFHCVEWQLVDCITDDVRPMPPRHRRCHRPGRRCRP